jgi:hypothetical protein
VFLQLSQTFDSSTNLPMLQVAYPIRTSGFDAEMLNLEFPNTVGPFVSWAAKEFHKKQNEIVA